MLKDLGPDMPLPDQSTIVGKDAANPEELAKDLQQFRSYVC